MATHYGVAVIPARRMKPRDKAKVEAGVLLVERWIMAALRKRRFFSLGEVNQAIAELLTALNDRPRRSLFEVLDKPALRALPTERYHHGDWATARVNIDYHRGPHIGPLTAELLERILASKRHPEQGFRSCPR